MGMRGNNSGLCYYSFSRFAGGILVVYFCSCPYSLGRVVYALLLNMGSDQAWERSEVFADICIQTP